MSRKSTSLKSTLIAYGYRKDENSYMRKQISWFRRHPMCVKTKINEKFLYKSFELLIVSYDRPQQ